MFKNLLLLVLLVMSGYTYYWLDKTDQLHAFFSAAKSDATHAGGVIADAVPIVSEKFAPKDGWKMYTNDTYQFALAYPEDWDLQEVTPPTATKAIKEISIQQKGSEAFRPSTTVRVFTNEDALTVAQWWNAWLAEEDTLKDVCVVQEGADAPCLYLRDRIQDEGTTTVADTNGISVELTQFDSTSECTYMAHGKHILSLCHDAQNPNDPAFEEHAQIYQGIRDSFTLYDKTDSQ